MTPLLRDILLFVGTAIAAHFLLIGPLFGFIIVSGGAVFVLPILALLLLGALALDHFVVRPGGTGGWLLTGPVLGLCANVGFLVFTTDLGNG